MFKLKLLKRLILILLTAVLAIFIWHSHQYLKSLRSEKLQLIKEHKKLQIENSALKRTLTTYKKELKEWETRYEGSVIIKPTVEGGYLFCVDGKPLLLKGFGYNPTPIGKGYDYNFFTDPNKPWLIDGKLMKEAGINCIRIYSVGNDLEKVKEFIKDMYEQFGIYTIVSDWLGLWDYPRANYADKTFQQNITKKILTTVEALKNEKGLLMWVLGNENNYTFTGRIGFWTSPEIESIDNLQQQQNRRAEIYYTLVDDIAGKIKQIDKVHPVALGNGEANFLNTANSVCKNIDLLAIIIYRGKKFGNLFENIKNSFDLPILVSEFGCDSYDAKNNEEVQDIQSNFLLSQWKDLYQNTIFSGNKSGNVLGGCLFEWTDEWWKHNEGYEPDWSIHNTEAGWSHSGYYFDIKAKNNQNMNEEWFGVVALSEEVENNINKRVPKKSYYELKEYLLNLPQSNLN